jgi:hypothetical protein
MGLESVNAVKGSARVAAVASEQERARKEKHGDEFSSELRHESDEHQGQHEDEAPPRRPAADSVVLGYESEVSVALCQQGGLKLSLSSLRPAIAEAPQQKPAKAAQNASPDEPGHIDSLV